MRTFILTKKVKYIKNPSELSKINGLVVDSLEDITRRIDKCVIYFPDTFCEKYNAGEITSEDTFIATIFVNDSQTEE